MRESVVNIAVDMLNMNRGEVDVMPYLRSKCTIASLSSTISRVRSSWIKKQPIPSFVVDILAPFTMTEPGVCEFLSLSLQEMIREQRKHRVDPSWSQEAEKALSRMQFLPEKVLLLKLTETELVSLKRKRERNLISKQESLLHVYKAGDWLQYAVYLAQTSTKEMSFPRLALPLLLLSGRRTTEILNGKSSFLPLPSQTTTTFFIGQIKNRGNDQNYAIPILCEYNVFAYAMSVLRSKQDGEILDSANCNNRYQSMLDKEAGRIFAFISNVHQLRSAYASFAYHLYKSDVTFNRAIMRMLGHQDLALSLSYNCCKLHDLEGLPPTGSFGPIP